MARRLEGYFPKAKVVYRIEWKNNSPYVSEFTVLSSSVSSVVLQDGKGRQLTAKGRVELSSFAATIEEAVALAFKQLCHEVRHDPSLTKHAVKASVVLASFL